VKDATKILDRVYLRSVYCRWTGDIHADRYSGNCRRRSDTWIHSCV